MSSAKSLQDHPRHPSGHLRVQALAFGIEIYHLPRANLLTSVWCPSVSREPLHLVSALHCEH